MTQSHIGIGEVNSSPFAGLHALVNDVIENPQMHQIVSRDILPGMEVISLPKATLICSFGLITLVTKEGSSLRIADFFVGNDVPELTTLSDKDEKNSPCEVVTSEMHSKILQRMTSALGASSVTIGR